MIRINGEKSCEWHLQGCTKVSKVPMKCQPYLGNIRDDFVFNYITVHKVVVLHVLLGVGKVW